MTENNENLDHLLHQFFDDSAAGRIADDIRAGDGSFGAHPVTLNRWVQERVQSAVVRELARRKLLTEVKWVASVAAAVVITVLAGLTALLSEQSRPAELPLYRAAQENIWQKKLADNSALDQIEQELRELTESIKALDTRLYEPFNRYSIDLMELEELENFSRTMDSLKG